MKKIQAMRSSMAFNIIGAIVILLIIFGILVSALGVVSFTKSFLREYSTSTYHMADTATALVNGDHIEAYLAGQEQEEYLQTRQYLDTYCKKMSVSLVYVIQVDRSDYGRFVSVFNLVNNSVDNTEYTEWELGHKRDTTNDEYRAKYKALYENDVPYETVYRTNPTDGSHPHITTMVPVKGSAGDVTAILCIQRPIREIQDARRPYQLSVAGSTLLLAVLSSAVAAYFIRKQYVDPIQKISDEATRFAKENTKGEALGAISSLNEIASLARSIDTMETDMTDYIENLTRITAEKERMGTELALATRIQADMLPHDFPPFPGRSEFDIYATMDPAREVGGDFYDFLLVDEDHLYMVVADVSGKGIPAALMMMASKIILDSCAMLGQSAAEILTKTNEAICYNNQAEMFVTAWVGILEISTGKLTAASAGHEYPALKAPGGGFTLLKDRHGFVLGGMAGMKYTEYEIQLEPGSKLFLYTDGVPEATDVASRLFGTERMLTALNEDPDAAPEAILRNVRAAVDGFVKDAEQFDDLTMLCMEYRGPGQGAL